MTEQSLKEKTAKGLFWGHKQWRPAGPCADFRNYIRTIALSLGIWYRRDADNLYTDR